MTTQLNSGTGTRTAPPAAIDLRRGSPARTEYEMLGRLRLARTMRHRTDEPRLDPDAFHGPAGAIVREIAPLTEASPVAMLTTLLTIFGAMVGRGAFIRVGEDRHFPILFSLIVGGSGTGKGVSLNAVRPVLEAADSPSSPFLKSRVVKGFQSGEALVQVVADLASTSQSETGPQDDPTTEPDQRLLVLETEFSKILTVAQRQGSILSMILRAAWDGECLECRTRREQLTATHPHVGAIAHVTPADLCGKLDTAEIANGFANRFLPVWSSPDQYTHTPGALGPERIAELGSQLRECIDFAQTIGELGRSPAFEQDWASLYYILKFRPSGGHVFDSLAARAAPHILRLSMVYALLDRASMVDAPHLKAAAALWEFCEATVAHIWGATLGSRDLDSLYDAVVTAGPEGLSRSEINQLFSNNKTGDAVDELVGTLVSRELARTATQPTGGRPRQVLIAITP